MALAALIVAYNESSEPGGRLRATLPLAGRTLVERQARLAVSAGAAPIIILVERLPADLIAAIDRLRAEGISAVVARDVAEAAAAIHIGDRLLLVADGLIADAADFNRVAAIEGNALLTIPDQSADERFERIDAHSRWAGLAILDGGLLRDTAAILEDWDLQSTLLRRAVQSGARQFAFRPEGAAHRLTVAERLVDLRETESFILSGASAARADWPSRYMLAPVERSATRLLMPTALTPEWIYILAGTLTGLAAFLFARDWLWAGLLLLLIATPLDGIADRLGVLRLQPQRGPSWWSPALPALAGAALVALGYSLAQRHGWGCLAIVTATIAFLFALRGEVAGHEVPGRHFLAERKGMTWLLLPFALAGAWVSGLGALAVYAAGSFFWAQRQVHTPISTGRDD